MGRAAGGVRAIKLGKGDSVIGVELVKKGETPYFLTMSENGLGKKTSVKEYKAQKRGGSGVKTAKVTPKTGKLIIGKIVGEEGELIAISKKGQVIKVELATIPSLGRQTQGVTIMKLRAGDSIASLTCL
jgi:DNA gyrase subunit A